MSPSYFLLVLVVSRSPSAVNAAPDRPLPLPQSLLGPRATVMAAAATATALVAAAAVVGNLAVLSLNEEGIQPIAASVGRFRHRRGLAPTPESTVETTPQPAVETPQAESAVETPPEPAVETMSPQLLQSTFITTRLLTCPSSTRTGARHEHRGSYLRQNLVRSGALLTASLVSLCQKGFPSLTCVVGTPARRIGSLTQRVVRFFWKPFAQDFGIWRIPTSLFGCVPFVLQDENPKLHLQ